MRNEMSHIRVEQLTFNNQFNIEIKKMQDDISSLKTANV